MKSEHTPTPWAFQPVDGLTLNVVEIMADFPMISQRCVVARAYGWSPVIRNAKGEEYKRLKQIRIDETNANASFIVRACNSHDELLDIAHRISNFIADYQAGSIDTLPKSKYDVLCAIATDAEQTIAKTSEGEKKS